jgi:aminoglycoside 2''-phosphotransferase
VSKAPVNTKLDPTVPLPAAYVRVIDRVRAERGAQGAPAPTLLHEDWDSVDIETDTTADGGLIFRFAKHQAAAERQATEAQLLPFVRSHVTPAIPVPELYDSEEDALPHGVLVQARLAGSSLGADVIDERNVDRLARQIAQFLVELHEFPAERAQALGAAGPRQWRGGFEAMRAVVVPALRRRLPISEYSKVRRWWSDFLADEQAWGFPPVLVHRNLVAENILVDAEARVIIGVIGWGEVVVGDAAVDFVGLVESYGSDVAWRVAEAYMERGSSVDGTFLRRVRRLSAATPFTAIQRALDHPGDGEGEGEGEAAASERDIDAGIARLRSGPILS